MKKTETFEVWNIPESRFEARLIKMGLIGPFVLKFLVGKSMNKLVEMQLYLQLAATVQL